MAFSGIQRFGFFLFAMKLDAFTRFVITFTRSVSPGICSRALFTVTAGAGASVGAAFASGLAFPQFEQKLPVFPFCPQSGQIQSAEGLVVPQLPQKFPVFPACEQFGQVHSPASACPHSGRRWTSARMRTVSLFNTIVFSPCLFDPDAL